MMALLWGIILLALGLSLAVMWSAQVFAALQGILPLFFLFLGLVFLIVGYSERKAARECDAATENEKDEI